MRFVKENKASLKSKATLTVPSGLVWKVDLVKRKGKIWLDKGWKRFSDYHSLTHGYVLLFKYLGDSHFSVVIIDRSSTEISYPISQTGAINELPSHSQKRKRSCSGEHRVERKGMSGVTYRRSQAVGPRDTDSNSGSESSSETGYFKQSTCVEEEDEEVENEQWNWEIDAFSCSICMEAWTNEGDHHICCLPCGHVFGFSCINKWLEHSGSSGKCPQCGRECALKDVRKLFVPWNGVKESQKMMQSVQKKYSLLKKKEKKKEAVLQNKVTQLKLILESLVGNHKSSSSSTSTSPSSSSSSSPASSPSLSPSPSLSSSDVGEVKVEEVRSCNGAKFFQFETNVTACRYFSIPNRVLLNHNITLNEDLILRDEKGKDWGVGVRNFNGQSRICRGVGKFRRGRRLQRGDKIVFSFPLNQECKVIDVKVIHKHC